jgi:MazG family protein
MEERIHKLKWGMFNFKCIPDRFLLQTIGNTMKEKLLASLFDPDFSEQEQKTAASLITLLRVVSALRHPEYGCPWDREQTHESLRSYLLEEAFEAVEAIDENVPANLREELGDVLLQIALHSQLASEKNSFTFKDVADSISRKMIDRHPHVFADTSANTSEQVLRNWEEIKAKEKSQDASTRKQLSEKIRSLPKTLPALLTAERIGEKSARTGFDWNSLSSVYAKVQEEYTELETELKSFLSATTDPAQPLPSQNTTTNQPSRAGEEIGDCLFTLTQLARWLGLSAEDLLRQTHNRFLARIRSMEEKLPQDFLSSTREDIEAAWNHAKNNS